MHASSSGCTLSGNMEKLKNSMSVCVSFPSPPLIYIILCLSAHELVPLASEEISIPVQRRT